MVMLIKIEPKSCKQGLVQKLLSKKTILVGTIRKKNRVEISSVFTNKNQKETNSVVFPIQENFIIKLCCYVSECNILFRYLLDSKGAEKKPETTEEVNIPE